MWRETKRDENKTTSSEDAPGEGQHNFWQSWQEEVGSIRLIDWDVQLLKSHFISARIDMMPDWLKNNNERGSLFIKLFTLNHLYKCDALGGTLKILCFKVWFQKTNMVGLSGRLLKHGFLRSNSRA